jgi:hypothetical protein
MHRSISQTRPLFAIALAVAAFGLGSPARAQGGFTTLYPGQPRVSVGARAGVSVATLTGDAVEEAGYKPGFAGGLVATLNVNPILALQPEVLYVQRGTSVDADGGQSPFGADIEEEIRVHALEIPFLVRLNVPMQGAASPHLYAGPSLGVVLSATREFGVEVGDSDADLAEDDGFEDALEDIDVGVVVGGGFDVRLPAAGKVTLDGRYTFGLTDVFDEDSLGLGEAPDAKNGVFQVTLGVGL